MKSIENASPEDDEALVETLIESHSVYDGNFLKARRDTVRLPNGKTSSREYIVHPGAVVIVPLLSDDTVLVERQFRYPVAEVMTEFPAGKLDPGEPPLTCAIRELVEETGYRAREWAYAGKMHLAIAYSTEIIHVFFARCLTPGSAKLDDDEFLQCQSVAVADLFAAARDGLVTDAKTLTCLLWLQNARTGGWPLNWQPDPGTVLA